MNEIVYLNVRFMPKKAAKISPNNRGFIFADGVYEVAKYYYGKPFRYDDHIERLKISLKELKIGFIETDRLKSIFSELINRNNLLDKHAAVYLQITRGEHKRVHHFPENIQPTVYAFAYHMPSFTEALENGIKVITHDDIRWQRCDIKSVSLLPNTMLFNKAVKAGAGECVLIREGMITEATHSSVLGIKNGVVITQPLSNLILSGITRKVILEICAAHNISFEEREFSENEFYEMDEIIIAGTSNEIMPVIQVNDKFIGNKKPGKITRFIQQKFFEIIEV